MTNPLIGRTLREIQCYGDHILFETNEGWIKTFFISSQDSITKLPEQQFWKIIPKKVIGIRREIFYDESKSLGYKKYILSIDMKIQSHEIHDKPQYDTETVAIPFSAHPLHTTEETEIFWGKHNQNPEHGNYCESCFIDDTNDFKDLWIIMDDIDIENKKDQYRTLCSKCANKLLNKSRN